MSHATCSSLCLVNLFHGMNEIDESILIYFCWIKVFPIFFPTRWAESLWPQVPEQMGGVHAGAYGAGCQQKNISLVLQKKKFQLGYWLLFHLIFLWLLHHVFFCRFMICRLQKKSKSINALSNGILSRCKLSTCQWMQRRMASTSNLGALLELGYNHACPRRKTVNEMRHLKGCRYSSMLTCIYFKYPEPDAFTPLSWIELDRGGDVTSLNTGQRESTDVGTKYIQYSRFYRW